MVKLLGNQMYYVRVKDGSETKTLTIDEKQYKIMFDGINNDAKYINLNGDYYFWSLIEKFGKIEDIKIKRTAIDYSTL